MTDFGSSVRRQQTDYIIRNLCDTDYYKMTMGYFIYKFYKGTDVTFKVINRKIDLPLAKYVSVRELTEQLEYVRSLRWRKTDLFYLRGMNLYDDYMFDDGYIKFLENLRMTDFNVVQDGDQLSIEFSGPWEVVTFWELYALPIISELYARYFMRHMTRNELNIMYGKAIDKLANKLYRIKAEAPQAKIADFGLRRRHSFLWQRQCIEMAKEILGDQFVGTSNIYLAMAFDLTPIGTNAHELWSVVTALAPDSEKQAAQYDVMRKWERTYGNGLRIVLPDTYTTEAFINNMSDDEQKNMAENWKGFRQDSGKPSDEADTYISFWERHNVNPKDKTVIFSDGLDVDEIIKLTHQYNPLTNVSFGWGTNFTNDFIGCLPNGMEVVGATGKSFDELFKPFSLVCKAYEANGNKVIKLSNNPSKATGDKDVVEQYKTLFNIGDLESVIPEV